jgi:hypothetical protein
MDSHSRRGVLEIDDEYSDAGEWTDDQTDNEDVTHNGPTSVNHNNEHSVGVNTKSRVVRSNVNNGCT